MLRNQRSSKIKISHYSSSPMPTFLCSEFCLKTLKTFCPIISDSCLKIHNLTVAFLIYPKRVHPSFQKLLRILWPRWKLFFPLLLTFSNQSPAINFANKIRPDSNTQILTRHYVKTKSVSSALIEETLPETCDSPQEEGKRLCRIFLCQHKCLRCPL